MFDNPVLQLELLVKLRMPRAFVLAAGWHQENGQEARIMGYPLRDLWHFGGYCLFTITLNSVLFGLMIWMFHSRWRVSSSSE